MAGIIICQVFFTYDVTAQTFGIEIGKNNINLIFESADAKDNDSALRLNGQLLYSEQNKHQDIFASAGLTSFTGDSNGLMAGAGIRVIAADPLGYYLSALAVGVELAYRPSSPDRLHFQTGLNYAGESLTFADGDSVSWLYANCDYELMADASIRLGYRRIKTQQVHGMSEDFDRGVYLGLLWSF
ncbi:MAG: YfaZ family outer membrane protein [Gammaproteobacteria bacterium]|nr:YfaZ family outer membrane protein [Gammaproteobacteria bacterium]